MEERICSAREFIAPELSAEAYQQLSGHALLAVAHWRKRHPGFYFALLESGALIERANAVAAKAEAAMRDLTAQGLTREEAWAITGREWIFGAPGQPEATS